MKSRHKRALIIVAALIVIGVAALLILNALNSNIALYVTPSEVANGKAPQSQTFRIGGLVKSGSLRRDGITVHFVVTDLVKDIPVSYTGILPDLFKEGKGAVVQGRLNQDGEFVASEVLAKHDENYMPPEAKHALEQAQKQKCKNDSRVRALRFNLGLLHCLSSGCVVIAWRSTRSTRVVGFSKASSADSFLAIDFCFWELGMEFLCQ